MPKLQRTIKREFTDYDKKLLTTVFNDIAKIIDRRPITMTEEPSTRFKLQTITKKEMIDLLQNSFDTLNELQKQNIIVYLENNEIANLIDLNKWKKEKL